MLARERTPCAVEPCSAYYPWIRDAVSSVLNRLKNRYSTVPSQQEHFQRQEGGQTQNTQAPTATTPKKKHAGMISYSSKKCVKTNSHLFSASVIRPAISPTSLETLSTKARSSCCSSPATSSSRRSIVWVNRSCSLSICQVHSSSESCSIYRVVRPFVYSSE